MHNGPPPLSSERLKELEDATSPEMASVFEHLRWLQAQLEDYKRAAHEEAHQRRKAFAELAALRQQLANAKKR